MFCYRRIVMHIFKKNEFSKSNLIYYGRNNPYRNICIDNQVNSLHNYAQTSSYIIKIPKLQSQIKLKYSSSNKNSDKIIGYEEFSKLLNLKKLYVIDVREEDELRRTGSIPSSVHIPLGEVKQALEESSEEFEKQYGHQKPNKTDEIVMYCQSGRRSMKALKEALHQGYNNSKSLEGGFIQWLDNERQKKE